MNCQKARDIIMDALDRTADNCGNNEYAELLDDLIDELTERYNAAQECLDSGGEE